ncbi:MULTISPECIES: hypothetical protein [Mesoplasma]|uniref:HTH rpiR-type domain-containing protein n=1 Tax=Mesoplasma florum TaxID=2151 RepID=A0A2R3P6G1_MESFO|nr:MULTISPECIES: hypothetical protein [Mesoplasma]AVN64086.1 hypothetical protein CG003_00120 [Mesoplasma florum]
MENFYEKLEYLSKGYVDSAYKNMSVSLLASIRNGNFKKSKELAEECFVSESTVTKFSKYLGFSGYREMIFFLKEDHNSFFVKKTTRKNKNFSILIEWISLHEDFIAKFCKAIEFKNVQVNIFGSYQLQESISLLNKLLLSFDIDSRILYQNVLFANTKISKQSVNIIFFSGRDNETLEIFLQEINKSKKQIKNFLVISEKQKNKVKFECEQIQFSQDHSFVNRNLSVMMMCHEIANKLSLK